MRFVAVEVRRGRLSPRAEAYLDRPDVDELPYTPRHHTRWCGRSRAIQFASWEREGFGSVHTDELGVTAIGGNPRPRRGHPANGDPITAYLARQSRRPGWSAADELSDAYAFVRLDHDATGLITMDPLRLHPLYIAESPDLTVIGNRSDLVAEVVARHRDVRPARDVMCGAWLSFAGYLVGDLTGFEDVRLMPESSTARVEDGRITVESSPALYEGDPDDPIVDWEEVADELVADVTDALRYSLAESTARPTIELTGGKDSRLLLAVALRAGLAGEFRYTTYGPADLPDRQVAGALATRFDLDHHSPTRSMGAQRSLSDRYRAHVHATSGTSNCFDYAVPEEQPGLVLAGLFGECFRTATARAAEQPPITWEDAARRFRLHRKFGDAGLLDPDVEEVLRESGVSYFLEPSDRVRGPAALRPTFYFRCHVPRWQGPMIDAHRRRLNPFYSPTAIRAAFGMGSTARDRELVHRHVITQASAELATVPFANDTWRDEAVPRQQPVRGVVDASRAPRPRFERKRTQLALDLIDASARNRLFDVVDPTALRDAAARMHALRQPEVQQVLGAITSLIWLGETEMPSRPSPDHLSQDVDLRSPEEPAPADDRGAVER